MTSHQKPELAFVIPTKDRPADLKKLFESLVRQTQLPSQVIVVDASNPPVAQLCDAYPSLPITYVREFPPSLARQRNAGMAALRPEITVAGYLDDDLELAPDATERMVEFWKVADPEVGGAAFAIVNQPARHPLFSSLSNAFLLNSGEPGRLLRSGFATSIMPPRQDIRTDWLYGGATLWRRAVIAKYSYDEWYIGHGFLEDVDFSYRVSREWQLWVVAAARVWHWPHPISLTKNVAFGRQQVVNRIYFVRKIGTFARLPLWWALLGQCVRNGLESVALVDRAGLLRLWGNLLGFRDLLVHGTRQVDGVWK